jgi:hypothetical protein
VRDNDSLREKLAGHAAYLVANTAALGDDEGVINVARRVPPELTLPTAGGPAPRCGGEVREATSG